MIKEVKDILSKMLIWLVIIVFMMVSYISMSSNSLKDHSNSIAVIEKANKEHDGAITFFLEIINNNAIASSSDDSSSQSWDEDSTHMDVDLFHNAKYIYGKYGIVDCKSKNSCASENHNAPHIEFLSPPPEFISIA